MGARPGNGGCRWNGGCCSADLNGRCSPILPGRPTVTPRSFKVDEEGRRVTWRCLGAGVGTMPPPLLAERMEGPGSWERQEEGLSPPSPGSSEPGVPRISSMTLFWALPPGTEGKKSVVSSHRVSDALCDDDRKQHSDRRGSPGCCDTKYQPEAHREPMTPWFPRR